jgi:2'-5' RNA ligase
MKQRFIKIYLSSLGFKKEDPKNDEEKEHETWRNNKKDTFLIDYGGNEWHKMSHGIVQKTGKLNDKSIFNAIKLKEGIRLDGAHLYNIKGEAQAIKKMMGESGKIKIREKEGRKWYSPESANIGLYSNTTPVLKRKRINWDLDKNYVVSEAGLYSSLGMHPKSAEELEKFAKKYKIKNYTPKDKMHTTVLSTKNEIKYKPTKRKVNIDPKTYKWELLGPNKDVLALTFKNKHLEKQYERAKKAGAEFKYPEFKQHTTIAYKWNKRKSIDKLPVPKFGLTFHGEKVSPFDDNWLKKNLKEETIISFSGRLKQLLIKKGWKHFGTDKNNNLIMKKDKCTVLIFPTPEIKKGVPVQYEHLSEKGEITYGYFPSDLLKIISK